MPIGPLYIAAVVLAGMASAFVRCVQKPRHQAIDMNEADYG